MKISDIRIGGKSDIKKAKKKSPEGDFSSFLDPVEEKPVSAAGGLQPLGSLDGLLALQESNYDRERIKKHIKHGEDLLDSLGKIHNEMVVGNISVNAVKNLTDKIKHENDMIADPELKEIIDDIELRAEVELAKIQRDVK